MQPAPRPDRLIGNPKLSVDIYKHFFRQNSTDIDMQISVSRKGMLKGEEKTCLSFV